jgi:Fe(II)/alpha-ketoglutarate-dependent arginine beta-hydroxylase
VSDGALGATPTSNEHWAPTPEVSRADAAMLLVASILGDPFSHSTVQDGSLIINVSPIRGHEDAQLASSSSSTLAWHVEEAFHDFRADWLLLMCMRNTQQAATTFARIDDVDLRPEDLDVLFEERYVVILYSSDPADYVDRPVQTIPVLSGDQRSPFVRIDPEYMERELADPIAERALTKVIEGLDANLQDVILRPGDILVIDNLRAVHGRRPFEARYDGSDRWLRGLNVTNDLRKSAGRRAGSHGRVLASPEPSS